MEAFRSADRLVEEAFEDKEDLVPEVFDREVLVPARTEAEAVARTVGGELQHYLSQRLELVADDVRADLSAAISTFEGANTTAGQTARTIGLALETGSGLLSIGSGGVLLAVALINSWNPAGWILGAVAVGGMVISFVGGKFRKKAASDRTQRPERGPVERPPSRQRHLRPARTGHQRGLQSDPLPGGARTTR